MRAWYQKDMAVGLLYLCTLGEVRPDCPAALIQNLGDDAGAAPAQAMRVIPCEQQLPQQREQVKDVLAAVGHCLQHCCPWTDLSLIDASCRSSSQIEQFQHNLLRHVLC